MLKLSTLDEDILLSKQTHANRGLRDRIAQMRLHITYREFLAYASCLSHDMSINCQYIDIFLEYVETIDMRFRPDHPFNDLPVLPPAHDIETKVVLKACIEARTALAELRVSGQLIPTNGGG